jgi:peptidyl-prolyl cis-trans isomerase SurA
VLVSDLVWQVNQLIAQSADRIPPNMPPEIMDQLREHAMKGQLGAVLTTKLIINDLHSSNIPPEGIANVEKHLLEPFEEEVIPKAIEQYKVHSRAELDARLRQEGGSIALLRQSFLDSRLAQMWLSEQTSETSEITRDDLQREYEARRSEYEYPAKVRWQELQVRFDRFGGNAAAAYSELAKMGNQVRAHELGSGGAPMEAVARQWSHGFTASEGGIHDWTAQGSLVAAQLDAALFSLPVGRLSQIIPGHEAWHIVRVVERKESGRIPFEEAQAEIGEELLAERRNQKQQEYLDKLRKEVRIWTIYTGPTTAEEFSQHLARIENGATP